MYENILFNTLTKFFLFSIVTLISISTGLASGDSEVTTSSETSTDGSAQSFSEPNELNLFFENGTKAMENEAFEEAVLNFDRALESLNQSLDILREIDDRYGLVAILHNMAGIAMESQDFQKALEYFLRAKVRARSLV